MSVLIHGESGTGKELVASAIHNLSDRSIGSLLVINSGAIPENLLEAELFGHEKGAFTGAHIQRKGKFECANHGTVFLDEVRDLSPALQVKLLRFLQERKIERIGGREAIELDVRIIAATHKNLEQEIKNGNFRDDLFYRLCVINIELSPLREHGEDVVLLADYFLEKFVARFDSKVCGFTKKAKISMQKYLWPGNVRELQNKIKRAVILSGSQLISAQDIGIEISQCTKNQLLRNWFRASRDEVLKVPFLETVTTSQVRQGI